MSKAPTEQTQVSQVSQRIYYKDDPHPKKILSWTTCPPTKTQTNPEYQVLFEKAYLHVRDTIFTTLDPHLLYHSPSHTILDVLPWAEKLAKLEKVSDLDYLIVRTAALYHDTGYLDIYSKNEPFGCKRAEKDLATFGYTPEMISEISKVIMATSMPQSPKSLLGEIMCDADLSNLGSTLFFIKTEQLRCELNHFLKLGLDPRKWTFDNLKFLQAHQYFTKSAKKLLDPIQSQNIQDTIVMLGLDEKT